MRWWLHALVTVRARVHVAVDIPFAERRGVLPEADPLEAGAHMTHLHLCELPAPSAAPGGNWSVQGRGGACSARRWCAALGISTLRQLCRGEGRRLHHARFTSGAPR
jgi:hypothetical protein